MKKIINTMKYGDRRTRLTLLLTLISLLGAVGLLVSALLLKSMVFFFGALIFAFISIALAQTFSIYMESMQGQTQMGEPQMGEPQMGQPPAGQPRMGQAPEETAAYAPFHPGALPTAPAMETASGPSSGEPSQKSMKRRKKKEKAFELPPLPELPEGETPSGDLDLDELKMLIAQQEEMAGEKAKRGGLFAALKRFFRRKNKETELLPAEETKQAAKKRKEKKQKKEKLPGKKKTGTPEKTTEVLEASKEDTSAPHPNLVVVRQATEEDFDQYDRKVIKKVLHKYKVKRDHRMIMVDHCDELLIKQTPAYAWVKDKDFHLLLIEKEPRHITLPAYRMREMTYLKRQMVNQDVDYGPFKGKSMLAEMFRPYLPDYTHSTVIDDMSAYKNLYGFGPGIYVTNRSAGNIFDLLPLEFRVDDKVTLSTKVNVYFKDAYRANILLRDNVIDANGYADKIAKTLDHMAHSTISNNEFMETLNLMVKNKLITFEFADHYKVLRDRVNGR